MSRTPRTPRKAQTSPVAPDPVSEMVSRLDQGKRTFHACSPWKGGLFAVDNRSKLVSYVRDVIYVNGHKQKYKLITAAASATSEYSNEYSQQVVVGRRKKSSLAQGAR